MTTWWPLWRIKLRLRFWLWKLLPHRCTFCRKWIMPWHPSSRSAATKEAYHMKCLWAVCAEPRKGTITVKGVENLEH